MMKEQVLTVEEAYRAMFYFLEGEYELTKSDELGGILGSLSWHIWTDGRPADPAAWQDWETAVRKALSTNDKVSWKSGDSEI
ncbi:hypothetical protein [Achromobacter xylosoxidans]|uniref:hypothetical protein n=1 Tax=Alcaligenes xylosoxydans xylosoxydans TaxID=85698 RepID=UPI0034D4E416